MKFKPALEPLETRETPALFAKLSYVARQATANILPPPPDDTTPIVTTPVTPPAPPPTTPTNPPPVIP
jgi:hypothetical protein